MELVTSLDGFVIVGLGFTWIGGTLALGLYETLRKKR